MVDSRFFRTDVTMSLAELANNIGCELHGNGNVIVSGVAPIDKAASTDLTFLSNKKYAPLLPQTSAGACILNQEFLDHTPDGVTALVAKDPYVAYAKASTLLHPAHTPAPAISDKASIAPSAQIGKDCFIGDNVVIGEHVSIGDHCVIYPNTVIGNSVTIGAQCTIHANSTISHALIGNQVILHSGVRIGQDGFGFATEHGRHIKVPQLGRVVIENFVDIGANTCIDRGAGPDTVIGEGTQIDNLVQIGHNVTIGRGCVIVAQTGIAGSTKLEDYVVLGGQVGVAGHLSIGSMAQVAAQSGVTKNLSSNTAYGGYPAIPVKEWHRQTIALKKLITKHNKSKVNT